MLSTTGLNEESADLMKEVGIKNVSEEGEEQELLAFSLNIKKCLYQYYVICLRVEVEWHVGDHVNQLKSSKFDFIKIE